MPRKVTCIVKGCNSKTFFHRLTSVRAKREKWLTILGRMDLMESEAEDLRVCSAHFPSNQYYYPGSKVLLRTAVPKPLSNVSTSDPVVHILPEKVAYSPVATDEACIKNANKTYGKQGESSSVAEGTNEEFKFNDFTQPSSMPETSRQSATMAMASPITLTMICSIFKENSSELEKGENSYRCGNVVSMTYDGDVQPHILKGQVLDNSKENKYSVDISLNLDEGIVQGRCSCPREQSICHHMAALIINAHYKLSTAHNQYKPTANLFPLEHPSYKPIKSEIFISNNCPTELISIENTMDFVKEEECFISQGTVNKVVNVKSEQRPAPLDMSVSQRACVYLYCKKSRTNNLNHHFFPFPVFRDRERCAKWLENCGNTHLLTTPDDRLATLALCQDHFSDDSFYDYKKDRLIHTAVPLHYNLASYKFEEREND